MKGLLADINIRGHVNSMVVLMKAEPWKEFWDHLQLKYLQFSDVGLERKSPDSLIWQTLPEGRIDIDYRESEER